MNTNLNAIAKYLWNKGYAATVTETGVVVQDPVRCSNGLRAWVEFNEVLIPDWRAADQFIQPRS